MKLFFGGPSEPDTARSLRPDNFDHDAHGDVHAQARRDTVRDLGPFVDGAASLPDWAAWNLTLRTRAPSIAYR